jgi:pimeloyl-ACP methyl ester carboxylesterase
LIKISSKPTILLVHGSWHNPDCFDKLTPKLEAAIYPVVIPRFPSSGSTTPSGRLIEVGQAVAAELERLIEEQEKDVIVVGLGLGQKRLIPDSKCIFMYSLHTYYS